MEEACDERVKSAIFLVDLSFHVAFMAWSFCHTECDSKMHVFSHSMASKSKPPTLDGQPKRRLSDQMLEENSEMINQSPVRSSPNKFSSTSFFVCLFVCFGCTMWVVGS